VKGLKLGAIRRNTREAGTRMNNKYNPLNDEMSSGFESGHIVWKAGVPTTRFFPCFGKLNLGHYILGAFIGYQFIVVVFFNKHLNQYKTPSSLVRTAKSTEGTLRVVRTFSNGQTSLRKLVKIYP